MTTSIKENKMGTMPIKKLLFTMSAPAILSMLVQALYNIVDSFFVARYSVNSLTAVSLAFPIQMLIISLCIGMGVGINTLIARNLGEKNNKEASNIAEHGFIIYIFLYLIVLILGLLFADNFFTIFTKDANLITQGTTYITIIMVFSFGRIFAQVATSILQGSGNMIYPMRCQLIGAIGNIILDPILIFGYFGFPAMGIRGAAIATVISQIASMFYIMYALFRKDNYLKLNLKNFQFKSETIKNIIKIGFPATLMQALMSVMLIGLNLILSTFGEAAVTVMGIYYKIESLVFMPIIGLSQGAMPIVGYSFGAKNKKRLNESIKLSLKVSIIFMSICTILVLLFPAQLLSIFNSTEEMYSIGIIALRLICISFPFAAVTIVLSMYFQSTGKPSYSLLMSLNRQIVILLPVAYILGKLFGLNFVWLSFLIAEFSSSIISLLIFKKLNYRYTSMWDNGKIDNDILPKGVV